MAEKKGCTTECLEMLQSLALHCFITFIHDHILNRKKEQD